MVGFSASGVFIYTPCIIWFTHFHLRGVALRAVSSLEPLFRPPKSHPTHTPPHQHIHIESMPTTYPLLEHIPLLLNLGSKHLRNSNHPGPISRRLQSLDGVTPEHIRTPIEHNSWDAPVQAFTTRQLQTACRQLAHSRRDIAGMSQESGCVGECLRFRFQKQILTIVNNKSNISTTHSISTVGRLTQQRASGLWNVKVKIVNKLIYTFTVYYVHEIP